MLKVAVCDDDLAIHEAIARYSQDLVTRLAGEPAAVSTFSNPVDMLDAIEKHGPFDFIICDVYMPGILGTQAIQELRDAGDQTHVIFLTSSQEHAVDAFALHADNYLVKPVTRSAFDNAVGDVVQRILSEKSSHIAVKSRGKVVRVDFSNILCIKTDGNYQQINLVHGDPVDTRMTSKEIAALICKDHRFFKLGSSCMVNMDEVRYVDGRDVMLTNGEVLHIPVRLVGEFSDVFFDYMMRNEKM